MTTATFGAVALAGETLKVSLLGFDERNSILGMVAHDLEKPVRPGGVNGRPFWNKYSVQFMYPPAFDFAYVKNAVKYRFTVTDDVLANHVFEAA